MMECKDPPDSVPEKRKHAEDSTSDVKSEPHRANKVKDEPKETHRYVLDEVAKDFKSLPPPYSPLTIALDQNFIAQHPKSLLVRQRRGFTGHDFNVQTMEGTDLLLCRGSLMSKSGRRGILYYSSIMASVLRVDVPI